MRLACAILHSRILSQEENKTRLGLLDYSCDLGTQRLANLCYRVRPCLKNQVLVEGGGGFWGREERGRGLRTRLNADYGGHKHMGAHMHRHH